MKKVRTYEMYGEVLLFPQALSHAAMLIALLQGPATAPTEASAPLSKVTRWSYVLQGQSGKPLPVEALARAPVELLVVDRERGVKAAKLRQSAGAARGESGKLVLCYLSIGEAETYRSYWKPAWSKQPPDFLGPENPDWPGNFKVRYWVPEWQAIIQASLARIVDEGFDGVWLDIVDGYEHWGPSRPTAAREMIDFVVALSERARARRPGFLVVPQNGALILEAVPDQASRYLRAVDAIGAEDTFFHGPKPEDNDWAPQVDVLRGLRRFKRAGKPVLAVDYLRDPLKAKRFVEVAREDGFIPYVGVRALDRLVPQP